MSGKRPDDPLDLPLVRLALKKHRWRRFRLAAFSFALGCLVTWGSKDPITAYLNDARDTAVPFARSSPPVTLSLEDVYAMSKQGSGQSDPTSRTAESAGPPAPQFKPARGSARTNVDVLRETRDGELSRCLETPRPANEAILTSDINGQHKLVIHNGTDRDAVVKVRNSTRSGHVAFYVRARSTAKAGLPDAGYIVLFATGQRFSQNCDRFLDSFTTWRFPGIQKLQKRIEDQREVLTVIEFTLHRVRDGNIQRQSIPHSEWLG